MQSPEWDVVVMGGGPAGSSVANLLAQAGRDVLLLERETFPRFHVGESLLPALWDLWDELGVSQEIEEAGFAVKAGVNFGFGPDKEIVLLTAEFPEYFQKQFSYHVERAKFDDILIRRAKEFGATVREGWNVADVILEGDQVVGVEAGPVGGDLAPIRARVVVDATGRDCLIGRRLGIRREDSVLNKIAYWTHVRGASREIFDDATRTDIHTFDEGWIWYIPLANDVVSIGAVLDTQKIKPWTEKAPQERFDRALASVTKIADWAAKGEQVEQVQVVSNISYRNERFSGDGFVLIGDASMFIDPVFSAGVTIAIRSAKLAAESINAALDAGDVSMARFQDYEDRIKQPMQNVFKLIHNWYKILERADSINIFLKSQSYPLLRERLVVLLSGGYEKADMDAILAEAEVPS